MRGVALAVILAGILIHNAIRDTHFDLFDAAILGACLACIAWGW